MPEQAYPTLNGVAQSWAELICKATLYDGPSIDVSDLTSLDWDVTIERGVQKRPDGSVKARTRGAGQPNAKMQFYADGCLNFLEQLIDIANVKGYVDNGEALYGLVGFDFQILHTPQGTTGIRQVELMGCCLAKDAGAYSEGVDPDKNDVDLSIVRVVRTINGKRGRMI